MKHFTPLDLPQYDLLSCMNELLQQQTIDWGKHNQICINTTSDQPDNYHHGDASLKYDWNNTIDESDKDGNITNFTVPLRDKYLREKQFFEMWQKLAVNTISHKANYYDNYVGKMEIYQLGSDNENSRDTPTYAIQAIEVYPEKIGTMDFNYNATNQIQKITIEFGYKQWFNMGIESLAGLEFGQSMQTMANVKSENRGLFGKLPPFVQRAGKSIFNQGKTVLNPTGRIFKGKVFGPFF